MGLYLNPDLLSKKRDNLALRENSVRLQSFAILLASSNTDEFMKKKTEFPDTILLTGSENELRDLAMQFTTAAGLSTSQTDGFYLVDPSAIS